MIFSVWAPRARSVELVSADSRVALERAARGYWRASLDPSTVRGGYKYSIDGGTPLPDPRSRWQPAGVHGNSHVLDLDGLRRRQLAGFAPRPLRDAVIYELHIGTFTPRGTYAAAEEKLPHLAGIGVTHLELMPIASAAGERGWGYDGVGLFAPAPAYGTPEELARFIAACHEHGLTVLLDVVYNHLGPDGNYLGCYGPYFTDRVKTPWGEAVNFDGAGSDEVRRFFIDNALMWLRDYGFDGLRLDAVHAIYSFEATPFLEELALEVRRAGKELGRSFLLTAESDLNDPRLVHGPRRGGYGLDAHWADDFHHAVHRYLTGEQAGIHADFDGLKDVAVALRDGYVYQGRYSKFRDRRHGRAPHGVRCDQLIVCAQNHDQIGNRACGERLSMLLAPAQLKAVAALVLLAPFVPLLFQGEEWGATTPFLYFTDHADPELGRAIREGRAADFAKHHWRGDAPDPQARATFERSKLDWNELDAPPHAQLLDWHRRLIHLRHESRAALRGRSLRRAKVRFDAVAGWLCFEHAGLWVAFNFAQRPQRVPIPGSARLLLSSHPEHDEDAERFAAGATRIFRCPEAPRRGRLPKDPRTGRSEDRRGGPTRPAQ